jgi:pimeloyl-ACP methyl ester carboxylesterase
VRAERGETVTVPAERMIAWGDAEICTQAFGRPGDAPILMIMGSMASMLWWPEGICERLATSGRFVIRYDHRDTGRSTSYEPGAPSYGADDLVDDAVAVLDGYGIDRAHFVGMSMGGAIAQRVVLEHPARVATVTLISTTKVGADDRDLPGPNAGYLEHAAAFAELDWADREALAELLVRDARQLAGTRQPFDEAAARALVDRDLERTRNPESLRNHELLDGGREPQGELSETGAPVLVIHGTEDPLIPYQHGVALAEAVPGARLVTLEGGGHELNEGDWEQIVEAIVAHTATPAPGER